MRSFDIYLHNVHGWSIVLALIREIRILNGNGCAIASTFSRLFNQIFQIHKLFSFDNRSVHFFNLSTEGEIEMIERWKYTFDHLGVGKLLHQNRNVLGNENKCILRLFLCCERSKFAFRIDKRLESAVLPFPTPVHRWFHVICALLFEYSINHMPVDIGCHSA